MYWGIATTVWWSLYRGRTEFKDDFFTAEELETSRLTLDFMSNYIEEDEDEVRHMVVSVEGTDSCNMYQLILLPNPEVFHFGGDGEPNLDLVFVLISKRRMGNNVCFLNRLWNTCGNSCFPPSEERAWPTGHRFPCQSPWARYTSHCTVLQTSLGPMQNSGIYLDLDVKSRVCHKKYG